MCWVDKRRRGVERQTQRIYRPLPAFNTVPTNEVDAETGEYLRETFDPNDEEETTPRKKGNTVRILTEEEDTVRISVNVLARYNYDCIKGIYLDGIVDNFNILAGLKKGRFRLYATNEPFTPEEFRFFMTETEAIVLRILKDWYWVGVRLESIEYKVEPGLRAMIRGEKCKNYIEVVFSM